MCVSIQFPEKKSRLRKLGNLSKPLGPKTSKGQKLEMGFLAWQENLHSHSSFPLHGSAEMRVNGFPLVAVKVVVQDSVQEHSRKETLTDLDKMEGLKKITK